MFGFESKESKRIKELEEVISILQEKMMKLEDDQKITVYGEISEYQYPSDIFIPWVIKCPRKNIPIKEAIQMLMDNAGLKFELTKAEEEKVVLKKQAAPKEKAK